jgi:hypothetical protein
MPRNGKGSKMVTLKKDQRGEILPLLYAFIAEMGSATTKELMAQIKDTFNVKISAVSVAEACLDALYQKRVIAKRSREDGTIQEIVWSPESVAKGFPKATRMADYHSVVSAVMATPTGDVIASVIDDLESTQKGKGEGKWDRDMWYVRIWGTFIEMLLGGWPISPTMAEALDSSNLQCQDAEVGRAIQETKKRKATKGTELQSAKRDPSKTEIEVTRAGMLYFQRDFLDPNTILLHMQIVKGFLVQVLHRLDVRPSMIKKMAYHSIRLQPEKDLLITQLPVMSDEDPVKAGVGKPIVNYETIQPGTPFSFVVGFPRTNGVDPKQFRAALLEKGLVNSRNMSPARGTATGRFLMSHFEEIGNKLTFESLEDLVPKTLLDAPGTEAFLREVLSVEMPGTVETPPVDELVDEASADVRAASIEAGKRHIVERWSPTRRREWLREYLRENVRLSVAQILDAYGRETGGLEIGQSSIYTDLKEVGAVNDGDKTYVFPEDPAEPPAAS